MAINIKNFISVISWNGYIFLTISFFVELMSEILMLYGIFLFIREILVSMLKFHIGKLFEILFWTNIFLTIK